MKIQRLPFLSKNPQLLRDGAGIQSQICLVPGLFVPNLCAPDMEPVCKCPPWAASSMKLWAEDPQKV